MTIAVMCLVSFAVGCGGQLAYLIWRDSAKPHIFPYEVKISCDNTEIMKCFAEATVAANKYCAILDEINVKSVQCRSNMDAIRPIKDLH